MGVGNVSCLNAYRPGWSPTMGGLQIGKRLPYTCCSMPPGYRAKASHGIENDTWTCGSTAVADRRGSSCLADVNLPPACRFHLHVRVEGLGFSPDPSHCSLWVQAGYCRGRSTLKPKKNCSTPAAVHTWSSTAVHISLCDQVLCPGIEYTARAQLWTTPCQKDALS